MMNLSTSYLKVICQNYFFVILIFVNTIQAYGSPETFDFIVVGGGVAGCAVAGRLSENGRHSVLLLEAGGDPHPDTVTPALGARLVRDPGVTRIYETVPQHNAALHYNGSITYLAGRALGGGSNNVGMVMNRGSPHDFEMWANVSGDKSWNYSNMLKYFKRSETYFGEYPSDQHGFNGPIPISPPTLYAPQLEEWLEAGRELGFPVVDPNGPQRTSFTPVHYAMKFGRRVSSFNGYIQPYLESRRNLRVVTNAEVTRIMFQGTRAIGVTYKNTESTEETHFVHARIEVILSAGVVGSPAILLKSGVGPKDILDNLHNIPTVKILPVGLNFQDHTSTSLDFVVNNRSATLDPERDLTPENFRIYNQFGDGPYTHGFIGYGQAFTASSIAKRDGNPNWPDTRLNTRVSIGEIPGVFNIAAAIGMADWEASTSCVIAVRGKSRGRVTLNLTDSNLSPIIDMQYLSHPDDTQMFVDGIKLALRVYEKTEPFRNLGARYPPTPLSSCQHLKFRSDEYWRCYVRQVSLSDLHGAGTCRMGSGPRDPNAVVDPELKVIGIHGLRVVDASIMPLLANGNPMAAVYAIAEKASDMILKEVDIQSEERLARLGWSS